MSLRQKCLERELHGWLEFKIIPILREAQGFASGIWLFRNAFDNDIVIEESSSQHITFRVHHGRPYEWVCTVIYASPTYTHRESLWNHLRTIANQISHPWMLVGDFNDISSTVDRFGEGSFPIARALRFNENIDACGLHDLGFQGPKFTWHRKRSPVSGLCCIR